MTTTTVQIPIVGTDRATPAVDGGLWSLVTGGDGRKTLKTEFSEAFEQVSLTIETGSLTKLMFYVRHVLHHMFTNRARHKAAGLKPSFKQCLQL
ncbi:hypothetical protein Hanom_Chr06g00487221 [Helianthus anomalus]